MFSIFVPLNTLGTKLFQSNHVSEVREIAVDNGATRIIKGKVLPETKVKFPI